MIVQNLAPKADKRAQAHAKLTYIAVGYSIMVLLAMAALLLGFVMDARAAETTFYTSSTDDTFSVLPATFNYGYSQRFETTYDLSAVDGEQVNYLAVLLGHDNTATACAGQDMKAWVSVADDTTPWALQGDISWSEITTTAASVSGGKQTVVFTWAPGTLALDDAKTYRIGVTYDTTDTTCLDSGNYPYSVRVSSASTVAETAWSSTGTTHDVVATIKAGGAVAGPPEPPDPDHVVFSSIVPSASTNPTVDYLNATGINLYHFTAVTNISVETTPDPLLYGQLALWDYSLGQLLCYSANHELTAGDDYWEIDWTPLTSDCPQFVANHHYQWYLAATEYGETNYASTHAIFTARPVGWEDPANPEYPTCKVISLDFTFSLTNANEINEDNADGNGFQCVWEWVKYGFQPDMEEINFNVRQVIANMANTRPFSWLLSPLNGIADGLSAPAECSELATDMDIDGTEMSICDGLEKFEDLNDHANVQAAFRSVGAVAFIFLIVMVLRVLI